jgi:hypothetical protein
MPIFIDDSKYWAAQRMNLAHPQSQPRGRKRPAVLCILDGWGWRPEAKDNAILAAKTPNFDRMSDTPISVPGVW